MVPSVRFVVFLASLALLRRGRAECLKRLLAGCVRATNPPRSGPLQIGRSQVRVLPSVSLEVFYLQEFLLQFRFRYRQIFRV